jgi:hypothetical protein
MNHREKTPFVLLHLTLARREDGQPTQRTATCGTFGAVEEAFSAAREEASRELLWRRSQSNDEPVELLDTEWGYDLRQNLMTISRYWVYDRAPSALTA